jgi:RND family efflux transporter MFP subunit
MPKKLDTCRDPVQRGWRKRVFDRDSTWQVACSTRTPMRFMIARQTVACRRRAVMMLIALAACGKPGGGDQAGAKSATAPVKVPLVEARLADTPDQIVLTGTVVAAQRAEVTADTQGKVLDVKVDRGTPVKLGDPLVQLDVRSARLGAQEVQANLTSARAQRTLAEQECKRTQELLDKGAITRSEYDRQMTQCTAALQQVSALEARAAMMTKSVADGIVRAPFAGKIDARLVSPGEWVAPGRPLFVLVDDNRLTIEISVPESQVGKIVLDQSVEIRAVALPGKVFTAKVSRLGAEIGRTRSLVVEATIDSTGSAARPDGPRLVPGMFAEATLTVGKVSRVVLPRSAVVQHCPKVERPQAGSAAAPATAQECRGTWRAFVVVGGELHERVVHRGPAPGPDRVAILEGVEPGEKVVERVTPDIVDGLRVVE